MGTKQKKVTERRNPPTWTAAFIDSLKPESKSYKLAEEAPRGEGRLILRVQSNGTKEFFYRYRGRSGELDKLIAIGRYDASGRNGKTLAAVRKALREHRDLQRQTGDVREHRQAEGHRKEIERRRGSLEQLLAAYVDHLKLENRKDSAADAQSIFRRHVTKPFQTIAAKKANEVTGDDVRSILARMVRQGITRQVNKARAYLESRLIFPYAETRADGDFVRPGALLSHARAIAAQAGTSQHARERASYRNH